MQTEDVFVGEVSLLVKVLASSEILYGCRVQMLPAHQVGEAGGPCCPPAVRDVRYNI